MKPFRFALECPKCRTINTASKFFFAKNTIQCGCCGEEINVKQSRLISKRCPDCGKTFIYDQGKKNVVCPHCNAKMQCYEVDTVKYDMVTVNCPQCGCGVEAGKNNTDFECPLCGERFDVSKQHTKSNLVVDYNVSVIEYEGDNNTFVWKHPIEDFNMGSQIVVHESQEAIFFMNGQALDLFGPGRYTLDTENLPVIRKMFELPKGSKTPFHCEVYFINKTAQLGIKWGTPDRIRFLEPVSGIPLDIGASGELSLQVSNARKLLIKLVGTTGGLKNKDILASNGSEEELATKSLQSYFRAPLVMQVKSYLAQTIKEQKINILEIDEKLTVLSEVLRQKVEPAFEEYGLSIPQFFITAISLPEDDHNFKDMKALISAAWLKVKESEVAANITVAQRQIEIEKKTTELEKLKIDAEMKRISALAEADVAKIIGYSEAEVMAAKGYTQKDVFQTEVQKAYAEGIGQMGSNGGSAGGNIVSDMVGVVAGMSAMGNITEQFGKIMTPSINAKSTVDDAWTCTCGHVGNRGRFCEACGKVKTEPWICECGHTDNTNKFCGGCGKPKPEVWTCICGYAGNRGKFCETCGSPKNVKKGWDCACGQKNNEKLFCSNCGTRNPDIN